MGRIREDKVLEAILQEGEDSGVPKPFLALIAKMYEDQQELRRCIEGLMHGNDWKEKRVEKRLNDLEEKIDPEKAEKRKNDPKCETAGSSCGLSAPGVVG